MSLPGVLAQEPAHAAAGHAAALALDAVVELASATANASVTVMSKREDAMQWLRATMEEGPVSRHPGARALPALLVALGAGQLLLGLALWLVPGTFFEEIGPYGARNDHYMADLATFYLALGVAALVALRRPSWRVPVIALALIEYVLHALNHLIDVGEADPEWLGPGNLIAVALTGALLAWMLSLAAREQ